jgi:hypothetical protein
VKHFGTIGAITFTPPKTTDYLSIGKIDRFFCAIAMMAAAIPR